MIGYLSGTVLERTEQRILVKVGGTQADASGVGYEVQVPAKADYDLKPGSRVEFYIYTHVREDLLALYGFVSQLDKALFEALLRVKGVGPRLALTVLSGLSASDLVDAILKKRKEVLSGVSGIGKKTAELMVLELAPYFQKWVDSGWLHALSKGTIQSDGVGISNSTQGVKQTQNSEFQAYVDARGALMGLGFRESDIVTAFKKLKESEEAASYRSTEEVLRAALRELS